VEKIKSSKEKYGNCQEGWSAFRGGSVGVTGGAWKVGFNLMRGRGPKSRGPCGENCSINWEEKRDNHPLKKGTRDQFSYTTTQSQGTGKK